MDDVTVRTPDWVQDAIFYQIFPDRFARSGRVTGADNLEPWDAPPTRYGFKGGDLWGVIDRLDYIQDLGVNALYFCPVFQSAANHRYHTHDYYQVDPLLGGNQALRALLDAAHRRGLRVVLDGVFNHASRGFFQFNHILENGPASPYLDWFRVRDYPLYAYHVRRKPNYECWWGLRELPEFNTDNPAVRDFIFDVARYWIEFGIDGWRLDVPAEIDDDPFWRQFRRVVKGANPEAYIVGEIWTEGARWLQGDQFDGLMNYVWGRAVLGFILGRKLPKRMRPGGYPFKPLDAEGFARRIKEILALHPPAITHAQLNLLGSHDTARLLTLAKGDRSKVKLAILLQMTYPGAPCLYYGDEVGLVGGPDPGCRGGMLWDESQWDHDLLAHVRRLTGLRHELPALRWGDYVTLLADSGRETYAFVRRLPDDGSGTVLVLVNRGRRPWAGPLPAGETGWTDGTRLVDRLSGAKAQMRGGQVERFELESMEGAVWISQG